MQEAPEKTIPGISCAFCQHMATVPAHVGHNPDLSVRAPDDKKRVVVKGDRQEVTWSRDLVGPAYA